MTKTKPEEIKTAIRVIDWLGNMSHGYGCGYVGIPSTHPWYKKNYDSIECTIHGGLTYGDSYLIGQEPDGLWWVGFDTANSCDNQKNCDKAYVEQQVASLLQQAIDAI